MGRPCARLSRMVNSVSPARSGGRTSIERFARPAAAWPFKSRTNAVQADSGAFEMNIYAALFVEHPSGKRVGVRQAKYERAKADALHHSAHANRAARRHRGVSGHYAAAACQPIWTTLSSSTSTGTLRWPPANCAHALEARVASTSTSYSTKSRRCHSSHSRISRCRGSARSRKVQVWPRPDNLQHFADDVIDRGLHFLDARNVVASAPRAEIRQTAAQNLAAIIAQQAPPSAACACAPLRAP